MPYSMSHVQDPFHCICIIEFGTIVNCQFFNGKTSRVPFESVKSLDMIANFHFSFHEIDDNLAPLSDVKDIGPHR